MMLYLFGPHSKNNVSKHPIFHVVPFDSISRTSLSFNCIVVLRCRCCYCYFRRICNSQQPHTVCYRKHIPYGYLNQAVIVWSLISEKLELCNRLFLSSLWRRVVVFLRVFPMDILVYVFFYFPSFSNGFVDETKQFRWLLLLLMLMLWFYCCWAAY